MVKPVTWWLNQYLSGALDATAIPPAVLSWSRFFIFEGAREIVLMDTREERQSALNKIPKKIRPLIEAEVRRLWEVRFDL